ncbi:hypothetical protein [Parasulfitobacter algicola]|uniref:Uncharacterized protein n=1 Tax=Parasulfitobacter algicola TaxID=2614809 RepID=A0ABX2IY02_9RHOB|nr:hypothetical protein [Sulfitobacter algicola]NSX55288.1 hypothetical protein [Sulfitobacter algicola]
MSLLALLLSTNLAFAGKMECVFFLPCRDLANCKMRPFDMILEWSEGTEIANIKETKYTFRALRSVNTKDGTELFRTQPSELAAYMIEVQANGDAIWVKQVQAIGEANLPQVIVRDGKCEK